MDEIEKLTRAYERFVQLPWDRSLSGAEKVWFALYDPKEERRLRMQIPEFENVTRAAHHTWIHLDLTTLFATWMTAQEYREDYFKEPEYMELALKEFAEFVEQKIKSTLSQPDVDPGTVVAISGLASLFGLTSSSEIFAKVAPSIQGRMLVFFPGQYHGSYYRLLDARDGWNYLAIPITGTEEK